MPKNPDTLSRTILAGIFAWAIPGAGHYYLRQRGLAAVYFIAITFTFGVGLAVGGVKNSINPQVNPWLFLAEIGVGGYTTVGYVVSEQIPDYKPKEPSPYISYYPESDVAQIYLAIGGMLNLLAILDALMRAQTGGLPVFYFEASAEHKTDAEESR
jgi:hypothetical protein